MTTYNRNKHKSFIIRYVTTDHEKSNFMYEITDVYVLFTGEISCSCFLLRLSITGIAGKRTIHPISANKQSPLCYVWKKSITWRNIGSKNKQKVSHYYFDFLYNISDKKRFIVLEWHFEYILLQIGSYAQRMHDDKVSHVLCLFKFHLW